MRRNSENRRISNHLDSSVAGWPSVTKFLDYRSWLESVFEFIKGSHPQYSYAKFSKDLLLGSSNAHLVLSGKRKLTQKTALKISEVFHLNDSETAYLLLLVDLDQAKTSAKRDEAFNKLIEYRINLTASQVERDELAFFTKWHHAAIYELLKLEGSQDKAEWISQNLMPTVPLNEVKKSLELLVKLGYLGYRADLGRLYPTEATIRASKSNSRLAVLSMHQQMLDLAKAAITGHAPDQREITAATLRLSNESFARFKKKIIALREEMIAEAEEDKSSDEVVQVSFQMFPVTKKIKKK